MCGKACKCPKGKNTTPKCTNCNQEGHVMSYRGYPLLKKVQQARDNVLKAQKIKNQSLKKNSIKAQTIARIIRAYPGNPETQGQTGKRNYAQTLMKVITEKTKYNEQ